MLMGEDGQYNICPFNILRRTEEHGTYKRCLGAYCCAYDVIPAEYTADGKPVERCLMMMQPFYPAPCCGPITELKDEVGMTVYKEDD